MTLHLNNPLSQEQATVLAEEAVKHMAKRLLELADTCGLKVTIDLVPNRPLSTASVTPRIDVRGKRILNVKGDYERPDPQKVRMAVTKNLSITDTQHVLFETQQRLKK